MKVAIIAALYRHGWGYQETFWIQQLTQDGHQVRVLCPAKNTSLERFETTFGPYEVLHVATLALPHCVFLSDQVAPALYEYKPDLVMWHGPSMFFGRCLVKDPNLAQVPVVSFWGEHLGMHEYDWRKKGLTFKQRLHAIVWRVLRGRMIRAALFRSQVIVGNTPQTKDILRLPFGASPRWAEIEPKYMQKTLGFLRHNFHWDPPLRQRIRRELGMGPDDIVACFSSRFDPGPKARDIATAIGGIQEAMRRQPDLKAMVIGFSDNATSEQFRRTIASGPGADRIACHSFANLVRLNELYNASDIALFPNATISAQATMGTGLYVCLADNGAMGHLITHADQGVYFRPDDPGDLGEKIAAAVDKFKQMSPPQRAEYRAHLAEESRWMSYDQILSDVMRRLEQVAGGHNQPART